MKQTYNYVATVQVHARIHANDEDDALSIARNDLLCFSRSTDRVLDVMSIIRGRQAALASGEDGELCRLPHDTRTWEGRIVWQPNEFVDGYNAAFWNESYRLLRDTIEAELGDLLTDDDVAEEAILVEGIRRAGALLRNTKQDADRQQP